MKDMLSRLSQNEIIFYFNGIILVILGITLIIWSNHQPVAKVEEKKETTFNVVNQHTPHLKAYIFTDIIKDDYELSVKDSLDEAPKRVPNIEVLIHRDEADLKEFNDRLEKFNELNQIKREKAQFEAESKKEGKKIAEYEENSKVLKDFQTKISTLNIDVYMYNQHKYRMMVFKIENIGDDTADKIKFTSPYLDKFQECIICGEDINHFNSLKKEQSIFIKVKFSNDKFRESLKFNLVYQDIYGHLYQQEVTVPSIYRQEVIIGNPTLIVS